MVDKVHGIQATTLSMNERFSILQGYPLPVVQDRPPSRQMNRAPARFINEGISAKNNQLFMESMARRLERQVKIAALRERLGLAQPMNTRINNNFFGGGGGGMMRRSNSFGNLSQASFGNRSWNGTSNLGRSASFSNLSQVGQGRWRRGYRRRGAPNWRLRGQFRGYRQGQYGMMGGFRRANWMQYRGQRRGRGFGNNGGIRRNQQQNQQRQQQQRQPQQRQQQQPQQRQQQQQPIPTREELDHQLDEYMASSRLTLDRQLEEYMRMAEMETE